MVSSALAMGGVRRFSSAPSSRPALASCAGIGTSQAAGPPASSAVYPGASRWEVRPTSPMTTHIMSGAQAGAVEHQQAPCSNLLSPRVMPTRQFSTGQRDASLMHNPVSPVRTGLSPPAVHPHLAAPASTRTCRPGWPKGAASPPASPMVTLPMSSGTPPRSPAICLNTPPKTNDAVPTEIRQPLYSPTLSLNSPTGAKRSTISGDVTHPSHAAALRSNSPQDVARATSDEVRQPSFLPGQSSCLPESCLHPVPAINSVVPAEINRPSQPAALRSNVPPGVRINWPSQSAALRTNTPPGFDRVASESRQLPHSSALCMNTPPRIIGAVTSESRQPLNSPVQAKEQFAPLCLTESETSGNEEYSPRKEHSPIGYNFERLAQGVVDIDDAATKEADALLFVEYTRRVVDIDAAATPEADAFSGFNRIPGPTSQLSASSMNSPGAVSGETGGTSGVVQSSGPSNFSPSPEKEARIAWGGPDVDVQELNVAEARIEFAKLRTAIKDQLVAWSRIELSVADLCTRFGPSRMCIRDVDIDDQGVEKLRDLDLMSLVDKVNAQREHLVRLVDRCSY